MKKVIKNKKCNILYEPNRRERKKDVFLKDFFPLRSPKGGEEKKKERKESMCFSSVIPESSLVFNKLNFWINLKEKKKKKENKWELTDQETTDLVVWSHQ